MIGIISPFGQLTVALLNKMTAVSSINSGGFTYSKGFLYEEEQVIITTCDSAPFSYAMLAENMIRLSGAKGIEILEVGLRPGEKLYEELLMTDHLEKTENELIFIEREEPLSQAEIEKKLQRLKEACDTNDDEIVRATLKEVVPTYREAKE